MTLDVLFFLILCTLYCASNKNKNSLLSATLFLELWKRYSAEITHRWDLTGFDVHEEHPRPQYLARLAHVRRKKINAVTNTEEPQVPYWRMKLPATILSFSVVLLLVHIVKVFN